MHSKVLAILAFTAVAIAAPVPDDAYPPAYAPEAYTTKEEAYPAPTPYEYETTTAEEYPTATYETPKEYVTPTPYETPKEYATPTHYETPKEYATPTHYETPKEYATPTHYETPKEYATPTHYETPKEYATPTAYETPKEYKPAPSPYSPPEYKAPEPKPYKHHKKPEKTEADNVCSDNQKSACCEGGDSTGALLGLQCALSVLGGTCSGSVQCCDVDGSGELINLNLCVPISL